MQLIRNLIAVFVIGVTPLTAQNDQTKWYFGQNAALDFMTSPPTVILGSAMSIAEGCASIADAAGNLLFYTSGLQVWNSSNVTMANGTGLFGGGDPCQSSLIVRKPGSATLYYIFTIENGSSSGLYYSIVDISLAAGQGSVTVKNVPVYLGNIAEKLTGTYHCNEMDAWIVIHEEGSNNFRSYLFTSSGVNLTPVISSIGPALNYRYGTMKISPTGNKIGVITQLFNGAVQLYDFNPLTGAVTNLLTLLNQAAGLYSCEFSASGSRFYAIEDFLGFGGRLHQWNLCVTSPSAIVASEFTLGTITGNRTIQLAPNGKIYCSCTSTTNLNVINSPELLGAACNYQTFSQSVFPNQNRLGLPNSISRYKQTSTLGSFSYSIAPSVGCHAATFTPAPFPNLCPGVNNSPIGVSWVFGEPSSGINNTSLVNNPVHQYSSSGNYQVMQIFHYNCRRDTIKQFITIPPPMLNLLFTPACGNGGGTATVTTIGGIGPNTYTWIPSMQNGSVATNLNPGVYSVTVYDQGLQCKASSTVSISSLSLPAISVSPSTLVTLCQGGQNTISLARGAITYSWYPSGGLSFSGNSVLIVNPTVSKNYTITGISNPCSNSLVITASILPLPSPTITINQSITCTNSTISLIGAGGVSYQWLLPNNTYSNERELITATGNLPHANYILKVKDINGCENSTSKGVSILPSPSGILNGYKQTSCAPYCGSFTFIPQSFASTINSVWIINGQTSGGITNFCLSYPGNYTLTGHLTDSLTQCASNLEFPITVLKKPIAEFSYTPNRITAALEEPIFTASTNQPDEIEFTWHFTEGRYTTKRNGVAASFLYSEPGNYPVVLRVKNAAGCEDTLIKTITVRPPISIYVPNCFTPNSDMVNDIFRPIVTGIREYTLSVYSRWGEKIYESTDMTSGWEGRYGGEPCKDDEYAWKLAAKSEEGIKVLTGHVLLLRSEN